MARSSVGTAKADLDTPALCLDIEAVETNIQRMADLFRDGPVRLRPHAKTHKSPMLAQMQIAAGAIGITCAKLGEAEVMAAAGIKDILIANQVVGAGKIARLVNLAGYTEVMVAVDDAANVAELDAAAQAKGIRLRVLVELNIGMDRCGVLPGAPALELAQRVAASPGLRLEGLMGYEGHTVFIQDLEERREKTEASVIQLVDTADLLRRHGIPVKIVSSGGTGTSLITGRHPGVTEIQVGSYITMDSQYREEVGIDFAYGLTVLATVTSVRSARPGDHRRRAQDAHARLRTAQAQRTAGLGARRSIGGARPPAAHGGAPLKLGDKVELVPNHGCTTINLHDEYHVIRGGRAGGGLAHRGAWEGQLSRAIRSRY